MRSLLGFILTGGTAVLALHCGSPSDASESPRVVRDGGDLGDAGAMRPEAAAPIEEFSIVTEPDTACVRSTAKSREVYAARPRAISYVGLGRVGARLFARGTGDEGFSLFDRDGSNPSAMPRAFFLESRFAGSATNIQAIGFDDANGGRVLAQRFDLGGAALGATSELAKGRVYNLALGRSGQKALAVWSTSMDVRARALDETGAPGPADFSFETAAQHDGFSAGVAPSVASDGSDFLVVWSLHRTALQQWRTYAAVANASGVVGLPRKLFGAAFPIHLVSVVANGGGYAALFDYDGAPLVVPLDAIGRLAGPAHLFDGVKSTFGTGAGIAARGGELAIIALRDGQSDAFRPLDSAGRSIGPWVCVDDPNPTATHQSSIDCEGSECAILYAGPGASARLVRTDRLGMAVP